MDAACAAGITVHSGESNHCGGRACDRGADYAPAWTRSNRSTLVVPNVVRPSAAVDGLAANRVHSVPAEFRRAA